MVKDIAQFFQDIALYGLEKMGLYYSQYRAFVVNNVDPDGRGRIMVSVPEVHGGQSSGVWSISANQFSGKGYGSQALPNKNDVVWVKFEKGNPRKPIWQHGYFGKDEIPEELNKNYMFWFRSPKGLTILLDDKEGTITVYKKDGTIEPMVLGDTLEKQQSDLIDIILNLKIMTNLGPQGILPPAIAQLQQMKEDLKKFKSTTNKLS